MNELWRGWLHARADVTLGLGVALAILVTFHVLLRKREVTSAVGWIGLVWFAPILGAVSYFVLGINRVKRRARLLHKQDSARGSRIEQPSLLVTGDLAQLDRSIGRITARPLLAGTAVRIYHNGDEAYPAMLAAIAAATRSVGMSSYIFRDDSWGGHFIAALAEAHGRGVAVRVLIDGFGGGWLLSRAYRRLRRNGVAAARFMHSPLPWRMPFLNLRSHRKILVADGSVGFTGGMNVGDENVMATGPKSPVQDIHFRIEGPIVSQLTEAFLADWAFATNEDLGGDAWLPGSRQDEGAPARVISSGPDQDVEKVEFAILQAIACACTSIGVMTPYFLPDESLLSALAMAAMRGVAVDIVVPHTSDHPWIDWATRANIGPLLSNEVPNMALSTAVPPFEAHGRRQRMVPRRQQQLGHPLVPAELRTLRRDL